MWPFKKKEIKEEEEIEECYCERCERNCKKEFFEMLRSSGALSKAFNILNKYDKENFNWEFRKGNSNND